MTTVTFGNKIVNSTLISSDEAMANLSVIWNSEPSHLYTVIVYDMDAPYPAPRNTNSPYLHLLITNIRGTQISSGNSLIPYIALQPPLDSGPHTYNVDIYHQSRYINPAPHTQRNKFPIMNFVDRHQLSLLDRVSFKVGNPKSVLSSLPKLQSRKNGVDAF